MSRCDVLASPLRDRFHVGKSVARWDAKPSHTLLPSETQPPKVTFAPATAADGTGVGLGVTVGF
jgi:hypothetical protein